MKLIIGVTLFNSGNIIEKTLLSIMSQSHGNFKCFIIDDVSTDDSADIAEKFLESMKDERFILIRNKEKRYQGGNYDLICRDMDGIDDEDVFVEVDGDDWLPDNKVFSRVVNYYDNDVWIANGSFKYSDGRPGFTKAVTDISTLRKERFTASHLRTWKVFLWRALDQNDLKDPSGNWWTAACDLVFMYDMLEMAGIEHYRFMPEINYIYNETNPLNEHKSMMPEIVRMEKMARAKEPKKRILWTN